MAWEISVHLKLNFHGGFEQSFRASRLSSSVEGLCSGPCRPQRAQFLGRCRIWNWIDQRGQFSKEIFAHVQDCPCRLRAYVVPCRLGNVEHRPCIIWGASGTHGRRIGMAVLSQRYICSVYPRPIFCMVRPIHRTSFHTCTKGTPRIQCFETRHFKQRNSQSLLGSIQGPNSRTPQRNHQVQVDG